LATAWQIQGNCLAALGSSVAALSSLQTAREIFEDLVGEGEKDAEPSLAYVAASIGDAYATIGDLPPATAAFREALETLEKFEQEPFLAEKVNVLYRLSSALRARGDDDGAEAALREAVDVEERLLAIDEEDYFAPYAQLSTAHAELLLSRGAYEDALAALEQAISTLKIYLTADVALSRRTLAYALLDDSLRKRAIARMRAERFSLAACDLEEALEYLTLAMKKGENFDPTRRVLETCALIFDLGVARNVWTFVPETQEQVERFVAVLTPAERRRAAPTYAQLLLQRHVALSKTGRFDEARAATDQAVELLEAELNGDGDGDDENNLRLILAKARFQRAVYRAELEEKTLEALADFRATIAIYEETRRESELDETSVAFYLEAVCRRATMLAQAGAPGASEGLREAVREVASLLRRGRWRFLDEAANLSRTTFLCALAEGDELEALRVVRIWLRYFRRLRRRYVESSWTLELDANESENSKKSRENFETLEKIEAACVDLRRFRVGVVESRDWTPDDARLLSVDVDSVLGRPKETSAASAPNVVEEATGKVASEARVEESGAEAAFANAPTEGGARRFWRKSFERLTRKSRTAGAKENVESARLGQVAELGQEAAESEDDVERRLERLEAARRAFAAATADDVKTRALFCDLTICVRVVERRLLAGDWGMLNPISWALDKLTDLYFENGAILLAAEETIAASRRWETLTPPSDADVLTNWSALWQLQAATLRLAERKLEDGASADAETNADGANVATFDAEIERAFQRAFDATLQATQKDGPDAALAKMRLGEIGSAYLHWLTPKSRGDEAWAFVSAAGAELESRSNWESPIDLFLVGGYYSTIGAAADALQRPETLVVFEKVAEMLRLEAELVGERPEVLARRAAVRRRLGALAEARGDLDAASDLYWDALDDARRALEESGFDGGVFAIFASLVLFFLREDPKNRGRKAARLARNMEAAKENWSEEERSNAELGFWYVNTTAALSSVQRNGSFFVAKERFTRASEALERSSELAETVAETAPEVKFAEGLFWLRRGFGERGRGALREAVDGWARLEGADPERPTPDSLTAQVFIAATLTEERRFAEARAIFETIFPVAERLALEAVASTKRDEKTGRSSILGRMGEDERNEITSSLESVRERQKTRAREQLKTYCLLGDFFGMLAADEGRFDVAFRIFSVFRKLTRKMRGTLGKDDASERNVWHFWAEAALKAKKYRFAIAAATRSLEGRRIGDETDVAFFCEASRIRGTARFERNAWADRRAAANDVERALETMRGEFRAGRFFLRTEIAETLLLRARLSAARGDLEGARADAERARRLLETAARRGQERCRRLLEEDVAAVFAELDGNDGE
jgi:tetratricopeptide (TPR) repeat protein